MICLAILKLLLIYNVLLYLLTFFYLNSILSDVSITTFVLFWLLFAWNIVFRPFILTCIFGSQVSVFFTAYSWIKYFYLFGQLNCPTKEVFGKLEFQAFMCKKVHYKTVDIANSHKIEAHSLNCWFIFLDCAIKHAFHFRFTFPPNCYKE